jgi:hypothetical protein
MNLTILAFRWTDSSMNLKKKYSVSQKKKKTPRKDWPNSFHVTQYHNCDLETCQSSCSFVHPQLVWRTQYDHSTHSGQRLQFCFQLPDICILENLHDEGRSAGGDWRGKLILNSQPWTPPMSAGGRWGRWCRRTPPGAARGWWPEDGLVLDGDAGEVVAEGTARSWWRWWWGGIRRRPLLAVHPGPRPVTGGAVGVENRRRWTLPFVLVQAAAGAVAALAISEEPLPYRGQRQSFRGPAKMRAVIGVCWRQFWGQLLFFHLQAHFGGLLAGDALTNSKIIAIWAHRYVYLFRI